VIPRMIQYVRAIFTASSLIGLGDSVEDRQKLDGCSQTIILIRAPR